MYSIPNWTQLLNLTEIFMLQKSFHEINSICLIIGIFFLCLNFPLGNACNFGKQFGKNLFRNTFGYYYHIPHSFLPLHLHHNHFRLLNGNMNTRILFFLSSSSSFYMRGHLWMKEWVRDRLEAICSWMISALSIQAGILKRASGRGRQEAWGK